MTMKNYASHVLLAILLSSCTSQYKRTDNNEKLVRTYFENFNHHHWKEMAGMYIENAEFKDPSLGQDIVKLSRQQVIKKYTELNQVFPDLKDRVLNIYPSGDKNIIVEFISTGMAADRSKFILPVCTIFTIENNMITKDYTYYDNFEE
jgi:hypothetical protein